MAGLDWQAWRTGSRHYRLRHPGLGRLTTVQQNTSGNSNSNSASCLLDQPDDQADPPPARTLRPPMHMMYDMYNMYATDL